jgi:P-type Ca2+ transporter type 2C
MLNEKEIFDGLSSNEAERRLNKYGLNHLEKKKKISSFKIFMEQFNDFIIWVLIGATIISGFMGERADAITILIIVIMNAILGFIQEFKTEKSLEALKELTAPTAKVMRDGKLQVINAENVTIGDIIILESGDRVPADCYVVDGEGIMVDESLLTGESVGVIKQSMGSGKSGEIYMGTIVLTGKAKAKVINIGMNTEMGKIAGMLQEIESEKTPLKERLTSLGKILVFACIIICSVVTVTGIIRGKDTYEMFLLGVSLAVAAIPEGLPAIVTVALALGVSRMLKRNALIRKLPAVETLGCTSVICSDKTGTLTENNMTVKSIYINNKQYNLDNVKLPENKMLKKVFTYCNDCSFDFNERSMNKVLMGDPTETALVKSFFKDKDELRRFMEKGSRIYEIPFSSDRKLMSVIIKENLKDTCYMKGAPERVINKCKYILEDGEVRLFTENHREAILRVVEGMSLRALRCIAAAYKDANISKSNAVENDMIFVGVAGIIDPPRKEAKDAVLKCKLAGIRPVMITGDHKNTAYAIGKELGILRGSDEIMTGDEIDRLNDKELVNAVKKISIFARVNPNHKLRIVSAFKRNNQIVAMTGDGVNDAPAVKEADIGISMGISGTDVTKEASSMILLDDNFSTIVAAVEEGRIIYDNIRKFIRYLLSCNLGEVLTMFIASLLNMENPLLPIQILFVNLATDGLPAIALGVDPPDTDIMSERPRPKNEKIFARGLKNKIIIRGSLIGLCTLLTFKLGEFYNMDLTTCRTLTLCTLILSQLFHVFECRSEKHSIFQIKLFTNMYLFGAVSVSVIMLLCIIYLPFMQIIFHTVSLNVGQWCIVLFFSSIISMINSIYLYFR